MNVPVSSVAVVVVDDPLEERRGSAVREPALDLTVDDQRVQEPAGVVDGDVVEDPHPASVPVDLTTAMSTRKPCAADDATRSSASGGSRFGAA